MVQSDYPPPQAIVKFLNGSTRHTRRVEIYEEDGVTRWAKDTKLRLKDGSVSVDYDRDERRTLDLVLDNSDGVLQNAPGEFWYDKIIKVFRGALVEESTRLPRILVISDKVAPNDMGSAFRSVLVAAGFSDVQVNTTVTTQVQMDPYDIIVGLSNATGPQITALTAAYRAGKSVLVFDADAVVWAAGTVTGEVGATFSPGPITPVANSAHPVAQGWAPFSLLGSPPTVIDTFVRSASSGWGSADSGQAYTISGGVSSDYSVGSGYGEHLLTTIANRDSILSSVSLQDLDATFDVQCSQTPTGARIEGQFHVRRADSSNYYTVLIWFNTTGNIDLLVSKRVAGTISTIVSSTSVITGFSPTAFYRVRFRVVGTSLLAKIWLSTNPEPATWTLSTTDSALTAAASVAFRTTATAGNTNASAAVRFDNLTVTNETATAGDTTAYNFSAVTTDVIKTIAPVAADLTKSRITAWEDPGSGGQAVVVSASMNTALLGNVEFGKMIVSATSWLNPVVPIDEWETQVGEFMIDRISEPHFPHEMKITGRDYTKKCLNSKFAYTTPFDTGYSLEALISSIASNAGIKKKQLPVTGITVNKTFSFDPGVPRWEAMKQIANAYNYSLYFNAQGELVMTLFVDPSTESPALYIETGTEGQIASYEKATTDTRMYNFILVTGESSDSSIPNVFAIAQNTDPNSPTSIAEIGERVYQYSSSWLLTTQQCQDVADKFLAVHSLEEFELSFETLMLPWLDVGNILGFIDPNQAPGDPNMFLLTGLTFPLSLGPMSGSARRLTIVG